MKGITKEKLIHIVKTTFKDCSYCQRYIVCLHIGLYIIYETLYNMYYLIVLQEGFMYVFQRPSLDRDIRYAILELSYDTYLTRYRPSKIRGKWDP